MKPASGIAPMAEKAIDSCMAMSSNVCSIGSSSRETRSFSILNASLPLWPTPFAQRSCWLVAVAPEPGVSQARPPSSERARQPA